jgi:hypothetical protein
MPSKAQSHQLHSGHVSDFSPPVVGRRDGLCCGRGSRTVVSVFPGSEMFDVVGDPPSGPHRHQQHRKDHSGNEAAQPERPRCRFGGGIVLRKSGSVEWHFVADAIRGLRPTPTSGSFTAPRRKAAPSTGACRGGPFGAVACVSPPLSNRTSQSVGGCLGAWWMLGHALARTRPKVCSEI